MQGSAWTKGDESIYLLEKDKHLYILGAYPVNLAITSGHQENYEVPEHVLHELEKRMNGASSPYTEALDNVTQILRNIMRHENIVPRDEVEYRIRGRIKKVDDIKGKVQRKKLRVSSIEDLENGIDDIVGARCVVDYISQVYELDNLIQTRQEWKLAKPVDDYIASPTPTGYRSLHIVIMLNTTNFPDVLAEIQLRTMLQDAWATKTHPLTYRKEAKDIPEHWLNLIQQLSDSIHSCDQMFDTIRAQIEGNRRKEV